MSFTTIFSNLIMIYKSSQCPLQKLVISGHPCLGSPCLPGSAGAPAASPPPSPPSCFPYIPCLPSPALWYTPAFLQFCTLLTPPACSHDFNLTCIKDILVEEQLLQHFTKSFWTHSTQRSPPNHLPVGDKGNALEIRDMHMTANHHHT